MQPISLKFRPTEAQTPGMLSSAENKLLGGARGGGKSAFLGGKVVTTAHIHPGVDLVALRADLSDFKKTTLLEILKNMPSDKAHWEQNKTESCLRIRSIVPHIWSTIWYIEGKDPNSLKSGNIAGIYGDEAEEIPFATATHLAGGLRQAYPEEIWDKINPLTGREFGKFPPYEACWASNPAPCWLADVFPVKPEELALYKEHYAHDSLFSPFESPYQREKFIDSDYAFFPFTAKDNPHNPPGYYERLIRMYKHDPVLLNRNVYGLWDESMEGLVYQLLREHRWYSAETGKRLWVPGEPVYLGVDPGNGSGTYAGVPLQFVGDRVFQIGEFAKQGGADEDLVDWLDKQPWKDDVIDCIHDSALPVTGMRLRSLGVPARPCKRKDIIGQINAMRAVMHVDEAKGYAPYLMDEALCPRTREEMSKRRHAKGRSDDGSANPTTPPRGWDDCLKAAEYVIMEKMPALNAVSRYRKPEQSGRRFPGRTPQDIRNPLVRAGEYHYEAEQQGIESHLNKSISPLYRQAARRV